MRFLIILMLMLSNVYAAETPKNLPITIKSVKATFNQNTNTAVFIRNVVLTRGNLTITSDKLTVFRDKDGGVIKAVATGSVHINNKGKKTFVASSEKAIYLKSDQTLTLFGSPVIFGNGIDKGQGKKLIYHIDTKNSELFSGSKPVILLIIPKHNKSAK